MAAALSLLTAAKIWTYPFVLNSYIKSNSGLEARGERYNLIETRVKRSANKTTAKVNKDLKKTEREKKTLELKCEGNKVQ